MDVLFTVYCANDKTITIIPASILEPENSCRRYNSVSATVEETASLRKILLPGTPLTAPPRDIYSFSHFAALVRRDQNIESEDQHTISLPLGLAVEMLSIQNSYHITGVVSGTAIQEVEDALFPLIQPDIFPHTPYFVRLDDCSPKDSESARMPISSLRQLVLCLLTSNRARGDFETHVTENRRAHIYLHTWDEELAKGVEFWCFVPPTAYLADGSSPRVVAMSQYHWHRPFPVAAFEPRETVDVALTSAEELLRQILGTATSVGILDELKTWGFTFDVVVRRSGRVQLVEVNPFGANSGCGSCLFHWVDDAKLLYGVKKGTEVRLLI